MRGEHVHKKKLYFQIGLYVASKHPDLAKEIVTQHLHNDAIDQDLSHLPKYYSGFLNYLETAKPCDMFSQRKLFISAMLRIYTPGVYNQLNDDIAIGVYGFVRGLSRTVGLKDPRISKIIRQVITFERIYEDYRDQVDAVVAHVTAFMGIKSEAC